MGKTSRTKGVNGEREAAAALAKATGIQCRRSFGQYRSGADAADIVADAPLHAEVKRLRRIVILDALRQAERTAPAGTVPLALVREDKDTSWAIVIRVDAVPALAGIIRK
jgi:hypothetical protein